MSGVLDGQAADLRPIEEIIDFVRRVIVEGAVARVGRQGLKPMISGRLDIRGRG